MCNASYVCWSRNLFWEKNMAFTDKTEIPRRTMVLFLIIDTSGGMKGNRINAINTAIREVIPEIRDISNENDDALIKIAVLQFSDGARWLTPNGPVDINDYNWKDLEAAGTVDFGAACRALNEKLSSKENGFMKEENSYYLPSLYLFSDGKPMDDWEKEMDKLKQNSWFRAALKFAVAVGADADRDILKTFTGSMETVLEDGSMLMKTIRFIEGPVSTMKILFIIDVSESMIPKIEFINTVMKEVVLSLKNMVRDFEIKLAVMSFSSSVEWHTNGMVSINNYEWNKINAGGSCDLGKAINELGKANLLNREIEKCYPVIILISNGNTKNEWKAELENLNKNNPSTINISIALGQGVFREDLQEFATMNTILIPHSIDMFKRIIKYAAIPRIFNAECCAGEDSGYQYLPWMVWGDHFFQENFDYGHEHLGWFYLWNKCYYQANEDITVNDIEIYRKRSNDIETWWEEQKYNPILDECIIYKTNVKNNDKYFSASDTDTTIDTNMGPEADTTIDINMGNDYEDW
jgi:uncharacterized protein YegL